MLDNMTDENPLNKTDFYHMQRNTMTRVVASFQDLLLDVWREACRHIEIRESATTLAEMIGEHLPLASLLILRFDANDKAIELVAQAPDTGSLSTRRNCSAAQWRKLTTWSKSGNVLHGKPGKTYAEVDLLVPHDQGCELLAGPLTGSEGLGGAVVLAANEGEKFLAAHARMLKQLLEPFTVALENDRRLHELTALREAAEADRRTLLNRLGRQEMNDVVVGADSGLRHVMDRVRLVANSDVPVLFLGDTGTGKEVAARAIHNGSARSQGPFIRVNCGAIPAELIDSHLFGHEKGSFTGAGDLRQGWFERADGGTLFLDEIGELPLPAQVRLLRVLQEHQFERVGGQQAISVDVRIVAATHRDLATMVKAGTFREDLWYRINVFPILLPPLRERIEDIPALAEHFAHRAANRFGLAYVEPSTADLKVLTSYSWPGNIRELGAVIDRAAILGNGKTLEIVAALGSGGPIMMPPADSASPFPINSTSSMATIGLATLDAAMKAHIERALAATRGRVEGKRGAAHILGINPHTLRARMRKLGVKWDEFREE
jgi:transcriptional regulator with GAF, ATPase, and Fis domain